MTKYSKSTQSKLHSLGIVNLIVGILSIISSIVMIFLGFLFFFISTVPDFGQDGNFMQLYGFIVIALAPIALILGVIDIIASNKLRKPEGKIKGWVIYSIVVGALGFTSITGLLQLIFGIIALMSIQESEK